MSAKKSQSAKTFPHFLPQFPNYGSAINVPEIQASELTREVFFRDYVAKNRPLVIRNASKGWKALQAWTTESVAQQIRSIPDLSQGGLNPILDSPIPEFSGKTPNQDFTERASRKVPASETSGLFFIQRVEAGEEISAYGLNATDIGLAGLTKDLEFFPFVGDPMKLKSLIYAPRFFLHQGGYTDWHYHFADETVTLQAKGCKEFLLLPADRDTFWKLWSVSRERGIFEIDPRSEPRLQNFVPYRARLNANDAIFIPVFWWHAVEAASREFGVTLAFPFKAYPTTQFDMRFPVVRMNISVLIKRRSWQALYAIAMGIVTFLRYPFRRLDKSQ